jgi:hypothetical protein
MVDKLEQQEIKIEQIGLIPVIFEQLNRIDLIKVIDEHFDHHGNGTG